MKTWNNKIGKETKWSGDESTFGFPVSGDRVEEFVKESLQKKIGYLYLKDNNLLGFADTEDYEKYINDPTKTDLVIQLFSIYTYTAYSNKNAYGNIIDFSLTESEGKEFLGICTTLSADVPTDPSKYKWTYIKGAPGRDGRDGIDGLNGLNGVNGRDGITPAIDLSTKHWMIGDFDTEVTAEGLNGLNGIDGKDGKDGKDGVDGQNGSDGSDGITPHINSLNNHWMIGDVDTGILAEGKDGKDGRDGIDGINGQDGINGEDGSDGGHYEFRYKNSPTQPEKPVMTGLTNGWTSTPSNPQDNSFTWMSLSFVNSDNTFEEWSTPIRITGENGKDGEDGSSIEFVYHTNNTGIVPEAPVTNLTDDWHGTSVGILWTDSPSGVLLNRRYEYISQRTKTNGVWGPYSTPVIWSKWGEKGLDGDKYEYIYLLSETNETPETPISELLEDYIPLDWSDEPGLVSEVLPYQWVCSRKQTLGTWGEFTTPVIWNKYAAQGTPGGHYEFRYKISSTLPAKPATGSNGTTNGWTRNPIGSNSSEDYIWFSLCFVSNNVYGEWSDAIRLSGKDGINGIDGRDGLDGQNGINGTSTYFHIAYANKGTNDNITDFNLSDPTGRDYIGTCINENIEDPIDPSVYTWVLVKGALGEKGEDGIGIKGDSGDTYYIHIKYSNDGLTFTSNNGETPGDWMGLYVDTESEDSMDFYRYKWYRIKGDSGLNGQNAPYEVITYGKSIYSTAGENGPSDVLEWLTTAPLRTVGTFIWRKILSYNGNNVLQNTSYICMTGEAGSDGKNGKWYEYAGVWGTDMGSVTNTATIGYYVRYIVNNLNKFYMNIAPDGEANNVTPGTDPTKWAEMSDTRQFYIAKAFFGDYAEFGSCIINGDWMISRVGISGSSSTNYTDFDPTHPNEDTGTNFIPLYALNMRSGKVYMNDAELKGMITANSGLIGGFNVNSNSISSGGLFLQSQTGSSDSFISTTKDVFVGDVLSKSVHSGMSPDGFRTSSIDISTRTILTTNEISSDGSGSLGQGGISWDASGNFQVTQSLVNAVFNVLSSGQTVVYDDNHLLTSNKVAIKDTGISFINQVDVNRYESSLGSNCIKVLSSFRDGEEIATLTKDSLSFSSVEYSFDNEDPPSTSESLTEVSSRSISTPGSVTANSFVKTNGTSSQFLKADGSVDSNTYAVESTIKSYIDSRIMEAVNLVLNELHSGYSLGKRNGNFTIDTVAPGEPESNEEAPVGQE